MWGEAQPEACPQPCAQPDWVLIGGHVPYVVILYISRCPGHPSVTFYYKAIHTIEAFFHRVETLWYGDLCPTHSPAIMIVSLLAPGPILKHSEIHLIVERQKINHP